MRSNVLNHHVLCVCVCVLHTRTCACMNVYACGRIPSLSDWHAVPILTMYIYIAMGFEVPNEIRLIP